MPAKKSKRYEARVWLGRDPDGRQLWYHAGSYRTKKAAADAKARARIERPWEKTPRPGELSCEQWAERWLRRMETGALRTRGGRRYKTSTISTHRSGLVAFLREFGERAPGSITRTEAEDWAEVVAGHTLPSVVQLLNYIVSTEDGGVERNRFLGLSHRPAGRRNVRPPDEGEMLELSAACNVLGDYAPMMRALLIFAAYTLMRPSELMALDWVKIDLDAGAHGRVLVDERLYRGEVDLPKSNRERTVAITEPARRALDDLLELRGYVPAGLVFRNKTGHQLTAPTLTAYWKEVRARAGIDVEFYVATKHFGVWYLKVRLGVDDAAIAAQAGWSESAVSKMVATYAHAVDERRLAEIDAAFDGVSADANADADARDHQ